MQKFKVCFVGIGSIAKRHIENLRIVCEINNLDLTVDAYRHSIGVPDIDGINKVHYELYQMPDDYDVIFITNPTNLHLKTLELFHNKGKHFFIEKPVVSPEQINPAKEFSLRDGSIYYVACPVRYNSVIQYVKEKIPTDEIISVRSISSSYLPDWRPGQDYRETYSAYKEMGGGVSIDLIHEWDYLTYLFGWPDKIYHMIGKKSDLEINSDDYAIYIAEYNKHILELHLDYFGRIPIRYLELMTKNDTVIGDIVNNRISFLREGRVIDFKENRNDYQQREMEHFIKMIFQNKESNCDFKHGIKVLELTQGRIGQ